MDLRIFHREASVSVLGPGKRAVLWLQGCPHACPGCIIPESWSPASGITISVQAACDWLLECQEIEGVTFTGGEPLMQAEQIVVLLDQLLSKRDLGVVIYTGFQFEWLQARGTAFQRRLLALTDLLIDGLYLEAQHADLLWRGSANQRLLCLSSRYRERLPLAKSPEDRGAGLEFRVGGSSGFQYFGVPPIPHFREELERRLLADGIQLVPDPGVHRTSSKRVRTLLGPGVSQEG